MNERTLANLLYNYFIKIFEESVKEFEYTPIVSHPKWVKTMIDLYESNKYIIFILV